MSKWIDRRSACVLAWTLTLMIPLGLAVGVAWPWLQQVQDLEQEIATLDEQALRYRRKLATLPALQAELDQVRSNKDVQDFYFDAKTPALAGAELQRQVQRMVESSGGRVVSTQLLSSAKDEQPPTVRVRTQMQGKTDALLDVLYQIEQARPFLFVEQLTVRAPRQSKARNTRRSRARRSVRRNRNAGQLTIRLDVFGYALEGTP